MVFNLPFERPVSKLIDRLDDARQDFNLLSLTDRLDFRPGSRSGFEPPSLDFDNIFDRPTLRLPGMGDSSFNILDRINLPSPRDVLNFGFSGRDTSSSLFGDTFNFFSKLQSGPGVLETFGLHGGGEEVGGILGRLNPSNWFGGGGERGLSGFVGGGSEGGLSGMLGGLGTGLPILKGILGALKGDWKGVAGNAIAAGLSFVPVVGPFIGIASALGVDKLLGSAAKGIGNAVKSVGKGIVGAVGGLFKKLF
jgi:hypothetical protein